VEGPIWTSLEFLFFKSFVIFPNLGDMFNTNLNLPLWQSFCFCFLDFHRSKRFIFHNGGVYMEKLQILQEFQHNLHESLQDAVAPMSF
jgi:hypothetical protein